jgi:hypothetical protein
MRKRLCFFASLVPILSTVLPDRALRVQEALDIEDYAVYATLINQRYIYDKNKLAVIRDKTWAGRFDLERADEVNVARYIKEQLSPLEDTFDDFQGKNKRSYKLERKFDLKVPHVLISEKQSHEIFKQGVRGWTTFYEKYRDSSGEIQVSRVGFNRRRNQALVYVARMCGGLCGSGVYSLLEKTGGAWTIIKQTRIWAS